ncbi:MAG: helix-hairpin-helix domain-containing protein [Candidatus Endonucleobacter bathymodioli]|uniref:Helix-hairpin-helix domain-containing protein n=1 Tax=Candidatus Endonucleibacter bathymodioli TaxID=539814 RepID=A0AA90NXG7_9GAMM|nr:helix-hairpin-helix domain-containing protein [Candidatus Endonucleobacter bathymodioli]
MIRNFIAPLLIAILSFSSLAYAEKASEKININTASATVLDKELKYVGSAIAERIVEYRKTHGDFATAEALSNVRGIGKKVVEANKNIIITK